MVWGSSEAQRHLTQGHLCINNCLPFSLTFAQCKDQAMSEKCLGLHDSKAAVGVAILPIYVCNSWRLRQGTCVRKAGGSLRRVQRSTVETTSRTVSTVFHKTCSVVFNKAPFETPNDFASGVISEVHMRTRSLRPGQLRGLGRCCY